MGNLCENLLQSREAIPVNFLLGGARGSRSSFCGIVSCKGNSRVGILIPSILFLRQ
jgi:hypothetical protein